MPSIAAIFNPAEALDWPRVNALCRSVAIDAVIVKDTDTVWSDNQSWVWQHQPATGNQYARAYLCADEIEHASP
jgi:hypothetical protein